MHIEHICSCCSCIPTSSASHSACTDNAFKGIFPFCWHQTSLGIILPPFLLGVDPLLAQQVSPYLALWMSQTLRTLLFQETRMIDCNSSTVMEGITRGMLEQTAVILFWTGSFPYKYLLYWKTDSYCSSDLEKILKNDRDFPCEINIKSCN